MAKDPAKERASKKWIGGKYGLSIVLLALFLITAILHATFLWFHYVDQERAHGSEPSVGEYVNTYLAATFENWQSEYLQLFSMVVLTSFLIHKGSAESKESGEEVKERVRHIEQMLEKRQR